VRRAAGDPPRLRARRLALHGAGVLVVSEPFGVRGLLPPLLTFAPGERLVEADAPPGDQWLLDH
jgi:hypothetical protein